MKQRGGKREGAGRTGKPQGEKFRHRMITLPPTLDDRLIEWSIKTGQEISPKLAQLIDTFLTSEGADNDYQNP